MIRTVALLILIALLSACAMPTGTTTSKNENPGLLVEGAPQGAALVVDGLDMGPASAYSRKRALAVLPGHHVVEIREGKTVIHREEVFVSAGAIRTISVPGRLGGER